MIFSEKFELDQLTYNEDLLSDRKNGNTHRLKLILSPYIIKGGVKKASKKSYVHLVVYVFWNV